MIQPTVFGMTAVRPGRSRALPVFWLLAAALVLPLIACAAQALPTSPTCTVAFDKTTDTAHPTSVSTSTLTFTGTIDVSMGSVSGSRIVLVHVAPSPGTWAATVDPTSFNVTGTAQVNFTATLVVPAAELATTRGTITVNASFQVVPGAPGSTVNCADQANVSVAAYYGLVADTSTPRVEVKAGPIGSYGNLIIHNNGNSVDSFRITLENKADLENLGLLTALPNHVTLNPNIETNVNFTINASTSIKEGDYDLALSVKSEGDGSIIREVALTAVVKNFQIIPTDDPTALILGGLALVGVVTVLAGIRVTQKRRAAAERARAARAQLSKIMRARRATAPQEAPAPEAPPAAPRRVSAVASAQRRDPGVNPPNE